jgi:hypothetical protein
MRLVLFSLVSKTPETFLKRKINMFKHFHDPQC